MISYANSPKSHQFFAACRRGDEGAIREMLSSLDCSQYLHQINGEGHLPLHYAALSGNVGAAKALIEAGADVNHESMIFIGQQIQGIPLNCAITKGHQEMAQYLIEQGSSMSGCFHQAVKDNQPEMIKLLAKAGGDLNDRGNRGDTEPALCLAIHLRNSECFYNLLDAGADPNQGAPILNAANHQYDVVIRELAKAGANLNVQDNKGNTPLHLALQQYGLERVSVEEHFECYSALLELGADPTISNRKSQTALDTIEDPELKARFARLEEKFELAKAVKEVVIQPKIVSISDLKPKSKSVDNDVEPALPRAQRKRL